MKYNKNNTFENFFFSLISSLFNNQYVRFNGKKRPNFAQWHSQREAREPWPPKFQTLDVFFQAENAPKPFSAAALPWTPLK